MRAAYLLALVATALCGCNKGGAASSASGAAVQASSGACSGYQAGSNGVIRTFCDGPAVTTVMLGGASHTLKGGHCDVSGPMFSFNAGVVTGVGAQAPYPDYVGITSQGAGTFTNAVIPVHLDGKAYRVNPNSGRVDAKGGSFSGTAHPIAGGPDLEISGTFTC